MCGCAPRGKAAPPWKRWYWTARWRRRAKAHLDEHPLCVRCQAQGHVTPATVAHHKIPHRGDPVRFWEGELEGLCKPHHDSTAQREEKRGHVIGSDVTGRPVDPAHPWNALSVGTSPFHTRS